MDNDHKGRYDLKPLRVKELPLREQPRELVDRLGPEGVDEAMLLAVILRTGARNKNVVDLARELLQQYGDLTAMASASVDELTRHAGMGRVKAQTLKCALELARRLAREERPERPIVRTPEEVVSVLQDEARRHDVEHFWVLLLDTRYRLIREPKEITRGILEVFKEAIRAASAAVVLAHNHPSGDAAPSGEDIQITRRLVDAGKLMEIEVLDHVIIGRPSPEDSQGFCSLRESGLVEF